MREAARSEARRQVADERAGEQDALVAAFGMSEERGVFIYAFTLHYVI